MESRKTMKRLALLAFVMLLSVAAASGQITPSQDSYTNSATPTTNYGSKTLLDVDGPSQTTYIQFNLASIPAGASISQATLKLYVNSVTTAGSFNVDYVNSSWSEGTIDYSSAPPLGGSIASSVPVVAADKNQYLLINVTSALQAWLNGGETNNGIALVANGNLNLTFDSKENTTTSHPAELDVVFSSAEGTITGVGTASGSGLQGGGTSGTLSLSLTNACSSGQILQWNGSAWVCVAAAGTGTINAVTAGTALTGGGNTGNVTLNLDTTQVPLLANQNTFAQMQIFESGGSGSAGGAFYGYNAPSGSYNDGSPALFAQGGNGDATSYYNGGSGLEAWGGGGYQGGVGGSFLGGSGTYGDDGLDAIYGGGSSGNGYAGSFIGDLNVSGAILAGTKDFKIDHPVDPANKYLIHASVESSEMMNIYTGNTTTDAQGDATVQLPEWFEALNTDFRYQLTVIGQFAQAIVAREIQNHQFQIRTSVPNVKVSWQVTGVRQDAYAKAHPLVVEEQKQNQLKGFYIHPELFGAPEEKQIEWARHPRMMKRIKELRQGPHADARLGPVPAQTASPHATNQ